MKKENDYFDWLKSIVSNDQSVLKYDKLLTFLYNKEFTFTVKGDANRYNDGLALRNRYDLHSSKKPCSILEMMVALSLRIEETIMDNTEYGNRTKQWFWGMIKNLGLNSMQDEKYNQAYVEAIISNFLNRNYKPNGDGGLFFIKNINKDLRKYEIWYQLCWYLDNVM